MLRIHEALPEPTLDIKLMSQTFRPENH